MLCDFRMYKCAILQTFIEIAVYYFQRCLYYCFQTNSHSGTNDLNMPFKSLTDVFPAKGGLKSEAQPFKPEFFSGCFFQLLILKAHCEDHNFTHVYPQFTYMIFIYSYSYIITIIGYMTNSQLTMYPCGFIAQWIEHCSGIARSWVRVPFKPEMFSGCFFNCLS